MVKERNGAQVGNSLGGFRVPAGAVVGVQWLDRTLEREPSSQLLDPSRLMPPILGRGSLRWWAPLGAWGLLMIAGCDGRGVSSQLPEAPLPGETSSAPSEQPETAPSAQPETAPSEQATDASSVVEVDDEVAETITREEWLATRR